MTHPLIVRLDSEYHLNIVATTGTANDRIQAMRIEGFQESVITFRGRYLVIGSRGTGSTGYAHTVTLNAESGKRLNVTIKRAVILN